MPNLNFILRAVKGNGKTLGLDINLSNNSYRHMVTTTSSTSGGDLHLSPSTGGTYGNATVHVGLTTVAENSGIESEINSNIRYVIKY